MSCMRWRMRLLSLGWAFAVNPITAADACADASGAGTASGLDAAPGIATRGTIAPAQRSAFEPPSSLHGVCAHHLGAKPSTSTDWMRTGRGRNCVLTRCFACATKCPALCSPRNSAKNQFRLQLPGAFHHHDLAYDTTIGDTSFSAGDEYFVQESPAGDRSRVHALSRRRARQAGCRCRCFDNEPARCSGSVDCIAPPHWAQARARPQVQSVENANRAEQGATTKSMARQPRTRY